MNPRASNVTAARRPATTARSATPPASTDTSTDRTRGGKPDLCDEINSPAPGLSLCGSQWARRVAMLGMSLSTRRRVSRHLANDNVRQTKKFKKRGCDDRMPRAMFQWASAVQPTPMARTGCILSDRDWVNGHHDVIKESQTSQCRVCHGLDYRVPSAFASAGESQHHGEPGWHDHQLPRRSKARESVANCHNRPTKAAPIRTQIQRRSI